MNYFIRFIKIFDFIFTLAKLSLQLLLINHIRMTFGMPLFLIADAIEYIFGIFKAFKVFIKSFYLIWAINRLVLYFNILRMEDVKDG